MIYRFEHEIHLSDLRYDAAVLSYDDPSRGEYDFVEIIPRIADAHSGEMQKAGCLTLVTALPNEFSGFWTISDDEKHPGSKMYADMVVQLGLPEYAKIEPNDYAQHLVAGLRVAEERFAVTSLFSLKNKDGRGRKPTESSIARQTLAEQKIAEHVGSGIPAIGSFDYQDVRTIAKFIQARKRMTPIKMAA